jgi:aldehyde:ferredoxin oxidoreductase
MHGNIGMPNPQKNLERYLNAVTGWERSWDDLLKAGERIGNMRHVFTLRENDNPLKRQSHGRIFGRPPQKEGPLAGISTNLSTLRHGRNPGALIGTRLPPGQARRNCWNLGLK